MYLMRLEKLRQVDLNLLIIFAVVAEEKSVTKAAARLLLSQPAVSRALQRARAMFQDDLVVRSSSGFELTLRGRKILQELEELLPKLEGVVTPSIFDPKREQSNFRISGPDNVCIAVLPRLCRSYATEGYKVNFDFLPWQADAAEMLERGKLDLILHIDDGLLPSHFSSEKLYREDWICAVARGSKFGDRLTLKQYLAAEHLTVTTLPNVQNIPDKQLAALGAKRRSSVRMPYFGAALSCLPGTELVLTLTSGMKQMVERNSALRLVKAPRELQPFHFLMVWHPRLGSDSRHTWLREAMRQAAKDATGQCV
ncbi:MAG TPA: LysR family transcriptional regulator [Candidatus Acidoferrum sp.]|jgi:DNA-binding transcriptional LysR family regulator